MAAAPDKPADTPQPLQQPNGLNVQSEARSRAAARVAAPSGDVASHQPGHVQVIRRNGKVTHFDPSKIKVAMTKAFIAVEGSGAAASSRIHHLVDDLSEQVLSALTRRLPGGGTVHIENIQDQVELALMRAGEHKVARDYVIYRDARARERAEKAATSKTTAAAETGLNVTLADGNTQPLDIERLRRLAREAASGLEGVDAEAIITDTLRNLFDGVKEADVGQALVLSARAMIEREPAYSQAAARLLLDVMRREALGALDMALGVETQADLAERYADYFSAYIKTAGDLELLDKQLGRFDLARLGAALKPERDLQFTYLGLQTLYDRYFIHTAEGPRIELPQAFFMRVAMGLAINEIDREERAIEFYELLSSFDFMSSTPTLFNSGTLRPQLSSCYLTTVPDDLDGIYGAIKDNALLSKFAGGLGNDWSRVRGMGAHIKGTNGKSQGVVPFLKVANDTAVAVNQCFAPETTVFTADGPKAIADIKVGDLVLGQRGRYREVTEHFVYAQKDAPMVQVRIKDSVNDLKVTAGHPFWAIQGVPTEQSIERTLNQIENGRYRPDWVEAGALSAGDYVAQVIPSEVVPVDGLTEEDARFYGILLGDGHLTRGREFGVCGNPTCDGSHLQFVRDYLDARGIHYWENGRSETYLQIKWAVGCGLARCATTGRWVGEDLAHLPFTEEDLYDAARNKRIARRFSHLPHNQTLALIQGLLETDGGISRSKEIYFTSSSAPLAEGLRYQLLRLGIPCAGQYRERAGDHQGTRSDGSVVAFTGVSRAFDLRIPADPRIAALLDVPALTKHNWFRLGNWVFTRVKAVEPIAPAAEVHDLKVEGDKSYMTAAALVRNGGKRKGAVCAYLETWHIDIEEFVELRKNTGDDRRRTHDMNTANWVPDLFMKRVAEDQHWTLFSPDETPDLHDLTGQAFEEAYLGYEARAERGELKVTKRIKAVDLWRKMLAMLFETGHPWITFKDPCNLRYTNQHVGQVHSSNLCTEITLHTNDREIAVCNLGSVNLAAHVTERGLDTAKLRKTVRTAMRMLDNVIDYNFYNVPQARNANLRHRPVGLGLMGFQDALYELRTPYASQDAVRFADHSMEALSYYAIEASSELAAERGRYQSFDGSLWSQGILPIDSVQRLAEGRGGYLEMDTSTTLDWNGLRERVQTIGMRNSNCLAIAPTATISNIVGVSQSIEPTYQNLFVKSNLSGEFTVVNPYLVRDLKALGLWDSVMVSDLKYYDGSLQQIDRIPDELKELYATAFEVDPRWLVEAGSRRQKWLDQAQSLNLYMSEPSGKKLDNLYKLAWVRGLKTTYYLRSMGATHVEKSTMDDSSKANRLSAVGGAYVSPGKAKSNGRGKPVESAPKACSIDDPECESCQ
ncbi:ribonucleoside-diphosphate reductase subunit alpha [Halochromatium salexigens]|uniref:Ribonucleoside-diphosphate reductase n=1 Tax=Halochromatium salexigens TaxID=49447 RepID=A0AAJ0UDH8_HALSE|nr:ribonucleoside-diphosphate reductase subunit alpha [Halochromatium salexigens]MBK5929442.1 ribonucleoside-diphosphate reductase subunit alpha [Halochromatium salexigens]